jgi:hypothetical protein
MGEQVLRKIAVAMGLFAATLAFAPAASAAGSPPPGNPPVPTHTTPAGVFPNYATASKACTDGIRQHRWRSCAYQRLSSGQYYLWVAV